jgi:Domain of unknown function (DUF4396)
LQTFAWISIALALASAFWIALDTVRRPQPMAVMNVVWPVSALYFGVFAVWGYYVLGRPKAGAAAHRMHPPGGPHHAAQPMRRPTPTFAQVAVGTSHCGAGCALADLACDFAIGATGFTLLGSRLLTEYVVDLLAAWALGVVFQYFAIKPMSNLTPGQALAAAVKADTLSILAFQVGMYAWMALVYFVFYPSPHLTPFDPRYWLTMQAAMICGFATSFPVNRWLIRAGVKEAM